MRDEIRRARTSRAARASAVAAVAALFASAAAAGTVVIHGRVLDAAGAAPVMANAHLTGLQSEVSQSYATAAADSAGRFALDAPTPGFYRLVMVAPNHESASLPLQLTEGEPLDLEFEVQLAPIHLEPSLSGLKAVGSWNAYMPPTGSAMARQADGSWACDVTVEADTVAYQVLNAAGERRPLAGTRADHYVYDGRGNYAAVLRLPAPGTAHLVFDPGALRRLERPDLPQLAVGPRAAWLAALWEMDRVLVTDTRRHTAKVNTERDKAGPGEVAFDWSRAAGVLERHLRSSGDERVRGFAAIKLKVLASRGAALSAGALRLAEEVLTPESTAWRWEIATLAESGTGLPEDPAARRALLQRMADDNPDQLVRALALVQLGAMADETGDDAALTAVYERMKTELAEVPGIERYIASLDPARRVRPGRPTPSFKVELLEDEGTVSEGSFQGKYVLLDFWATWCGPCVAEMANLHAANERFGGPRFEILSLSFDRQAGEVAGFRGRKWAMPWKHAFVAGGFQSELARAFEVTGIPKPVLLGPDGKILAMGGTLRGQRLFTTLEKHLGGGP